MFLGITDYPSFVIAILVFLAMPGPGTLMLLASVGRGGVRGGLAAIAGLLLGDQLLMWLAAIGVAAMLQAHPAIFRALQWAGAAYLIWIGLRLLLVRAQSQPATPEWAPLDSGYFRHALLVTLLNPKAIVFFMAFFPLFIDPTAHLGTLTFLAMAVTVAVVAFVYCVLLCFATSTIRVRLAANHRVRSVLEKLAGAVIVGFGLKLAQ